jgi:hypothetical protein
MVFIREVPVAFYFCIKLGHLSLDPHIKHKCYESSTVEILLFQTPDVKAGWNLNRVWVLGNEGKVRMEQGAS